MKEREIDVIELDGEIYLRFGYDDENEELLEFDLIKEGNNEC